ncbi:MAG TPA: hypothetical protein VGN17_30620 [Bryobacteraceae bacterium]
MPTKMELWGLGSDGLLGRLLGKGDAGRGEEQAAGRPHIQHAHIQRPHIQNASAFGGVRRALVVKSRAQNCSRESLQAIVGNYFRAAGPHQMPALTTAGTVRITENAAEIKAGEGFFKSGGRQRSEVHPPLHTQGKRISSRTPASSPTASSSAKQPFKP